MNSMTGIKNLPVILGFLAKQSPTWRQKGLLMLCKDSHAIHHIRCYFVAWTVQQLPTKNHREGLYHM